MIATSATLRRTPWSPEAEARRAEYRRRIGLLEPLQPCPPGADRLSHREWLEAGVALPAAVRVMEFYRRTFGCPPPRRLGPGGPAAVYSAREVALLVEQLP